MLETLNKYYQDELVQKQVHPDLPLTIWNYTPKTQYGETGNQYKYWDEVTLQCRGLITDDKGNVVARPFKKFFNMEENRHTPTQEFEVFEKMDGSLGIMFLYNNFI
jgi:RNA ligase